MNRLAFYQTNEEIEDEDIGYDAPLYSIDLYDQEYIVALGHERKLSSKKNTYYFPVYLIHESAVFKQIGVYEFESDEKTAKERAATFLDKDGDVDPARLQEILLYSFADRDFFDSATLAVSNADISLLENQYQSKQAHETVSQGQSGQPKGQPGQPKGQPNGEPGEPSTEAADPNDPLELNIPVGKISESAQKTAQVLKNGAFERDTTVKAPASLVEESKDESLRIKKDFKPVKTNKWIENFMKNNHYDIVETANNGDCYFDTIRIAFLQMGYKTSIEKLRAIVARSADESLFEFYNSQYKALDGERDNLELEIKTLKSDTIKLKRRHTTIHKKNEDKYKDEIKTIEKQVEINQERFREVKEMLHNNTELLSNFAFMKQLQTLDELREYMKTSAYWADERAIAVLEKELNFKTIVFAEYN